MNVLRDFSARLIITLGTMISSCANPTAAIESEVHHYKQEHPEQIVSFEGNGNPIRFAWSGDPTKSAVIFVHGSPGSWEGWAHFLLDPILQKQFYMIAIDRPGYGGSGTGKSEPSLLAQAEALYEVIQFVGYKGPVILVGHSFGGPVIARAAMEYPHLVSGLVFVASSVDPNLEETKWIQYPAQWWLIRSLLPDSLRVCNEEILPLKGELQSMLPRWKEITAKSVLIHGDCDELVPVGNLDFLVEYLNPNKILKTVRISGLNHFIPWKRPDLIKEAIVLLNDSLTFNSDKLPPKD